MSNNDLRNSVIFPIGEKFESDNFKGTVWLKMLTLSASGCPIGNVTFEPGCRNRWHKHAGGQILLVTGARELHAGDVVEIPADMKHWHGAAKDSWFSHLAIEVHSEKGPATWMEHVSDEDYTQLN